MSVKDGIAGLVGSRVTAVVVTENPKTPSQQVFLVLDGRWYYELYGGDIHGGSSVREADLAKTLEYARRFGGKVVVYGD